jgi:hypothetical protein
MQENSLLVEAWIRRYAHSELSNKAQIEKDTWWAYEAVDKLSRSEPQEAFELITSILSSTNDEVVLENLAAGPLETLLVWHGQEIIGSIKNYAAKDLRFKWLLAGVWPNNINPLIWQQLIALTKGISDVLPPKHLND